MFKTLALQLTFASAQWTEQLSYFAHVENRFVFGNRCYFVVSMPILVFVADILLRVSMMKYINWHLPTYMAQLTPYVIQSLAHNGL